MKQIMKVVLTYILLALIVPVVVLYVLFSISFLDDIGLRFSIAQILYEAKIIFLVIFVIGIIFFKKHKSIFILVFTGFGFFLYVFVYRHLLPF